MSFVLATLARAWICELSAVLKQQVSTSDKTWILQGKKRSQLTFVPNVMPWKPYPLVPCEHYADPL